MKRTQILTGIALMTMLLIGGQALARDITDEPGYIDLEWISIPDGADEIQDIDLGLVLLSIAADAEDNNDEALLEALSMVKSIRVKSWSTDDDDKTATRAIEKVTKQLKKDEWKRMIYVKNDEETVTVSTRHEDGDMVGLMLVTYEPGGTVAFVNVMGDLDLSTLFKLVQKFDHNSLDDMLEELEDVDGIKINRRSH